MEFQKLNIDTIYSAIRKSLGKIHSPYNDGWVQSSCKQELYLLKCWLEEEYNNLPNFVGEELWEQKREQDRVLKILKQK